jgi:hypothetical protein
MFEVPAEGGPEKGRQVRAAGPGAMSTNRFQFLVVPIAAASIALAACGGGDSPGASGNSRADIREAALKHARCMREHGVNVPDPKFGAGGAIQLESRGEGADKLKVERADEACRKYLEDVRPPELSPEQEREFREEALKHARCMREHGIDMPDPTFGSGGKVEMKLDGGVGPGNPRFDEAQRECAKYGGPKFGVTRAPGK